MVVLDWFKYGFDVEVRKKCIHIKVKSNLFIDSIHSVKLVGLFIFAAIGIAVIVDLWDVVDMKSGFRPVRQVSRVRERILY